MCQITFNSELIKFIGKYVNYVILNENHATLIILLIIKEVKEDVVFSQYEADGLAWIVTKIDHFFMGKKLDKKHIAWDSKNKELKIDLNKITELNAFLK